MNRARERPAWEGRWLALNDDANVAGARSFFSVDTEVLINEFAGYSAKPPGAFDVRLYNAASNHCADLILRDAQDHTNQSTRVTNSGFDFLTLRMSVFSYTQYPVQAHSAFNIDWGPDTPDGMQVGRGHRMGLMSASHDYYSNVGLAMEDALESNSNGPIVTAINYAEANTSWTNHYNRFLVGTVWDDANSNGLYDASEGKSDVTITPNKGDFYAVTADSGGWAFPATVSGTYVLTFAGAAIGSDVVTTVEVGSASVRVPWPGSETTTRSTSTYWHQSYGVFSNYENADLANDDSDDMLNWQEYVAGMNPTNGSSFFEITAATATNAQGVISWPSLSGRNYTVVSTDDLSGAWTNAPNGTDLVGINGTMSYTNTGSGSLGFFSIQVDLP